jgi:hypothetical protein
VCVFCAKKWFLILNIFRVLEYFSIFIRADT